jgi:hypothetical protein
LSSFNKKLEWTYIFSENPTGNFKNIHMMGVALFCADGQMDMIRLMVDTHFVNIPYLK